MDDNPELASIIVRLQAQIENQEMMISQMLLGFVNLTGIVEALRKRLIEEGDEEFARLVEESIQKVLETIQTGGKIAENKADKFYSSASEPVESNGSSET